MHLLFLREHMERLTRSAQLLRMSHPTVDELCTLACELVTRNKLTQDLYIRPTLYKNDNSLAPSAGRSSFGIMLYLMPYRGSGPPDVGLDVCVSNWTRMPDSTLPCRAKTTGGYVHFSLVKSEAMYNGYDDAILLNQAGHVCEVSSANLFLVRNNVLITPDKGSGILEGITRQAIFDIACDLNIPVQERTVGRSELYLTDELFMVGTGHQIRWIRSVDKHTVGQEVMGEVTQKLIERYFQAAHAQDTSKQHWLTQIL